MNVLKPHLQATVKTLLDKGISQREINRKTGVNRKTIRKYGRPDDLVANQGALPPTSPTEQEVATGAKSEFGQNPPPRPPARDNRAPKHARSACEPHREWIEEQVRLGRNGMAIYQDLVERFGFSHKYNSVKRFVRGLKSKDARQYDRLEFVPGEETQVDYGTGAPTLHSSGKYRRPRLFVMTLKYSGRAFRKVVWKSSKEAWCRLHEEAFRYFGGCPQYVTLDNLKEGVIKPDIYDPQLNELYGAVLQHYGVTADPARVGDANRKGTVENTVKHTQDTALKGRRFDRIESQCEWLVHWEERWAAQRIHGRAKRQVAEMFSEEQPYLEPLPLVPFRYFEQATRTVYDDGTIQVDKAYYAAAPAPLYSKVVVRIYDDQIEILDPVRMEVIRRHGKSSRPGSVLMRPQERIFNPSRQTDRLLARAEMIGPHTFSLCEMWFNQEGRTGQRRMYGLVNLVRHYRARHVEKAAQVARRNGLRSSKALRRMVESIAAEADETESARGRDKLTQKHPLIRTGEDYAAFWKQHAVQAVAPEQPVAEPVSPGGSGIVTWENLAQVWERASWLRVIEVFGLQVDSKRRRRDDEIWLKSPFTGEGTASMHVSLSQNVFKDFSSGRGGGIMQFCRQMLREQGRHMTMLQVAQWMVAEGISTLEGMPTQAPCEYNNPLPVVPPSTRANPAIKIDLRRYLRADHPELQRRGIDTCTCRYLGCGFLPQRGQKKPGSPLNGRLVFQIRGLRDSGKGLVPVIVSHSGRALSNEQEDRDGKYWSYPFRKGLEIYNQDQLLLDKEAKDQAEKFGLILVEGFFDAAKLVAAGCRNVGALMGSSISAEQVERLVWMQSRLQFPYIRLFLDRDRAGQEAARKLRKRLGDHNLAVAVFDWNQMSLDGQTTGQIPESIQDPADMSVGQLRALRKQEML
jgi:transposase/5S rRNA maturation endonuclease (ribonuclease M5)